MSVRWGIAGCSAIADTRVAPAILRARDAELVAVSSHDGDRARAFAARHGIARWYGSFDDLIADDQIDAVYIGGVNEVHADQTIRAARSNKHVLCEKPMATNLDDARTMIDVCANAGRVLGINHHLRGAAPHQRIRAEIAAGTIGKPVSVRVSFPVLLPLEARTWRLDAQKFGGVLFDIGTHIADLLRWLLGSDVRRVSCLTRRGTFGGDAEDSAVAAIEMADGCLGVIYFAYNAPLGIMGVEVQGPRGNLLGSGTLDQLPGGTVTLRDERGERMLPVELVNLYEQHVVAFGQAMRTGSPPLAGGEDGYRALEAALAMHRSNSTGCSVEIGNPGG